MSDVDELIADAEDRYGCSERYLLKLCGRLLAALKDARDKGYSQGRREALMEAARICNDREVMWDQHRGRSSLEVIRGAECASLCDAIRALADRPPP